MVVPRTAINAVSNAASNEIVGRKVAWSASHRGWPTISAAAT